MSTGIPTGFAGTALFLQAVFCRSVWAHATENWSVSENVSSTVTGSVTTVTALKNTTSYLGQAVETKSDNVVIILTGVLVGVALLGAIIFLWNKYRSLKMSEYTRTSKVRASSTKNAGVYMDLSVETRVPTSSLPLQRPVYNSMKKQPAQCIVDSADEMS